MPFVTEELWQALGRNNLLDIREQYSSESIALSQWPNATDMAKDHALEDSFDKTCSIVRGIRDVTQFLQLTKQTELNVSLTLSDTTQAANITNLFGITKNLLNIGTIKTVENAENLTGQVPFKFNGGVGYIDLGDSVDLKLVATKVKSKIDKLTQGINQAEKKLSSDAYVKNADPAVVEKTRGELAEYKDSLQHLETF